MGGRAGMGGNGREEKMVERRPGNGLRQGAGAVVVGALAAAAVVLLADVASPRGAVARPPAPKISATAVFTRSERYTLDTHCGVDEARIGDRYFEAVHPLRDAGGNPPPGWGNPYQPGTMTMVSPAEAVFTDHHGHHVVFRLRPGAKSFRHVCARPLARPFASHSISPARRAGHASGVQAP
jgi:hypothetical protein